MEEITEILISSSWRGRAPVRSARSNEVWLCVRLCQVYLTAFSTSRVGSPGRSANPSGDAAPLGPTRLLAQSLSVHGRSMTRPHSAWKGLPRDLKSSPRNRGRVKAAKGAREVSHHHSSPAQVRGRQHFLS